MVGVTPGARPIEVDQDHRHRIRFGHGPLKGRRREAKRPSGGEAGTKPSDANDHGKPAVGIGRKLGREDHRGPVIEVKAEKLGQFFRAKGNPFYRFCF